MALACRSGAREIVVSAAISLKPPLDEVAELYHRRYPDFRARINYGASGLLASQIERGAPVDVFASASEARLDDLEAKGLLISETRQVLAGNRLVVIAGAGAGGELRDLNALGSLHRLAIGNPRTVPAGTYAQECLQHLGLWDRLEPRLVFAENARQVLEYAVRGEVQAAIVYGTDAQIAPGSVRVLREIPENCHSPILYGIAVVASSRLPNASRAFIELVTGTEGQDVFRAHGFRIVAP